MTTANKSVTNQQARNTALIVSGVLLLLAAWNYHRDRLNVVAILGITGLALLLTGFVPPLARRFHVAWMKLAGILGYINSRVLLFLLFYLAITPYGLISRLFHRDPLNRRSGAKSSYWIPRKTSKQTREQFERSF